MATRKSTEERRREIADAAISIIGERGLREFTAARIAEEVGIKDATIFRHFKDMNEIKLAALHRLQELLEVEPGPTGDPLERLDTFVLRRLRSFATKRGVLSLLFSDELSHALGDKGQRQVAALRDRGRDFIESCLREAAAKGLLQEDLDIKSAVVLITGMVMGFLFAAKDGALPAPAGEMARRCWQTLSKALVRKQVLA